MFRISVIVIGLLAVLAIVYHADAPLRVEEARLQASRDLQATRLQEERNDEQARMLTELASMGGSSKEFSGDWQRAYPEPSTKQLHELRTYLGAIRSEPSVASTLTLAYNRTHDPLCNGELTNIFGSSPPCRPGGRVDGPRLTDVESD